MATCFTPAVWFDYDNAQFGINVANWMANIGPLYVGSVNTAESYLTDPMTLGDTFTFDYWWEMGNEPIGFNLDILFFNGTQWETFGYELNFGGNSDAWTSASFYVPEWAQGLEAQIQFSVFDLGQHTDPTVYLRNIGSNSAPVPEPATIFLLGTGLIGIAGLKRRKLNNKIDPMRIYIACEVILER